MKLNESKTVKLKAMTPIFIGSGESIKPLSYLIDGNVAHIIDEDRFFGQLSVQEQERYLQWIEPILNKLAQFDEQIDQAKDNFELRRQLQRQRREVEERLSIRNFITEVLKIRASSLISKCEAYAVKCNVLPERDGFRLCMKDISHHPYIPGTEIKGAIRTSLLYALIADSRNYQWFSSQLTNLKKDESRRKFRLLEKMASDLEAKLLRGEQKGKVKDDAKFDFLRFLHISDSTSLPQSSLQIELTQSLGTRRYTKTWIETIAAGSEASVKISIGDPTLILQQLGLERLFEWLSLSKFLEACFIRSRDVLEEETRFLEGNGHFFVDITNLKNLISQLRRENKPDSPLLRLGQGQGFLSITVDLQVKRRDDALYDKIIREGVSHQRRWRTQEDNFPKTRRVITDHRGIPVNLLGWVKVTT